MTQLQGATKTVVGVVWTIGLIAAQVLAVGLFLIGVLVIL